MPTISAFLPAMVSGDKKDSYTPLSLDDPEDDVLLQPTPELDQYAPSCDNRRQKYQGLTKQLLIILAISTLLTIVATSIFVTASNAMRQTEPTGAVVSVPATVLPAFSVPQSSIASLKPKDCGNNPTTARERGCHFDIMSMIWIPHECYDPELTAEFASEKSWEWSLHENGTDLISEEEIRKGDIQNGWVRFEYHITHCLYTWKKVIKQIERGGAPIDGYVSNHTHTEHCSMMLSLRSVPAERWNTPFVVLYPTCYV